MVEGAKVSPRSSLMRMLTHLGGSPSWWGNDRNKDVHICIWGVETKVFRPLQDRSDYSTLSVRKLSHGGKDSQGEKHTKPLLHYTIFYVLCVCVCTCGCRLTCTTEHMWRSEDNFQELVITFCLVLRQGLLCYFLLHHVKAGWSQVSRRFCLLSHHRSARIRYTLQRLLEPFPLLTPLLWDRVSCSPGWLPVHSVAKDNLELLTLQLLPPIPNAQIIAICHLVQFKQ